MAVKRKTISVKSKRVGETYQALHACWRARAIHEFRYGTRSETDQTMIWTVDGTEYAAADHAGLMAAVESALDRAGIARCEILAESWCGYPVLEIEREDGSIVRDEYDPTRTRVVPIERKVVLLTSTGLVTA